MAFKITEKSKIFVVDDDKLILKFLTQPLSTEYDVISTFQIEGSIELIKQNIPDIIVSDLMILDRLAKVVQENTKVLA